MERPTPKQELDSYLTEISTIKQELKSFLDGIGARDFGITDELKVIAYFNDDIDNEWVRTLHIPNIFVQKNTLIFSVDDFLRANVSNRDINSEQQDFLDDVARLMFQIEDGDFDGDIFEYDII